MRACNSAWGTMEDRGTVMKARGAGGGGRGKK